MLNLSKSLLKVWFVGENVGHFAKNSLISWWIRTHFEQKLQWKKLFEMIHSIDSQINFLEKNLREQTNLRKSDYATCSLSNFFFIIPTLPNFLIWSFSCPLYLYFLAQCLVRLVFWYPFFFFRQRIRCLLSFLFQECVPRFYTHFLNTSWFFSILSQTSRNFLAALDIAFMTILDVFERSGKLILTAPWKVKCVIARLLTD